MSFSTPQTLSITVSAADANRVQACSQALGYPNIKAMVEALVINQVSQYEQQAHVQTFASSYTPVAPS